MDRSIIAVSWLRGRRLLLGATIALWALVGARFAFLDDCFDGFLGGFFEWVGWAVAGFILLILASLEAWRDRRGPRALRSLLLALSPVATALILAFGEPALSQVGKRSCARPSDQDLLRLRRAHSAEFDELRALILADRKLAGVGSVGGNESVGDCRRLEDVGFFEKLWNCPDASRVIEPDVLRRFELPPGRYARYLTLLAAIGSSGVQREDGGVRISIYSRGFAVSGAEKDLVWSPSPPSPLVDDTERQDVPHDPNVSYHVRYAALEDGWYVRLATF